MKALHFAKPIEFRVETDEEAVDQGDSLCGSFAAINRGDESLTTDLEVTLAHGEFKSIKENAAAAFTIVETLGLGNAFTLEPGQEFRESWRFQLADDCPITTDTGSLFLLYGGRANEPGAFGMLDLRVRLSPVLETFIATVENHFSFIAGNRKTVNGYTEVAFKPPVSYPTLDKMDIRMRFGAKGMDLVLKYKLKRFARGPEKGLQSKTIELERNFPLKQVLIGNKHPNRAYFKAEFQAALGEAVPSLLNDPK